MLLDKWKEAELSTGCGENHFTMNRGSFRYRSRIRKKKNLVRTGIEEKKNGFCVLFSEPHYVVIYGDYRKELEILADMLNIKAFYYL